MDTPFGSTSPWVRNTDANVAPTTRVTQLTPDVAVDSGRAILLDVTGAGTVSYRLVSGDEITLNVQANQIYEFNDAVTTLLASGTTATLVAWVKY